MTKTSDTTVFSFHSLPRLLLCFVLFGFGIYACHWWGWYEGGSELIEMIFTSPSPIEAGALSFALVRFFLLSWVIGGGCMIVAFLVGGSVYHRD